MRSNILKIMTIVTILIIIILIVLIYMLSRNTSNDMQMSNENIIGTPNNINISNLNVEPLKNRNIYYTVINCINQYLKYIVNLESDAVYTVLDNNYIKKNNITKENVLQYVDKLQTKTYFSAIDILEEVVDDTKANYYVSRIYSRLLKRRYINKQKRIYNNSKI